MLIEITWLKSLQYVVFMVQLRDIDITIAFKVKNINKISETTSEKLDLIKV